MSRHIRLPAAFLGLLLLAVPAAALAVVVCEEGAPAMECCEPAMGRSHDSHTMAGAAPEPSRELAAETVVEGSGCHRGPTEPKEQTEQEDCCDVDAAPEMPPVAIGSSLDSSHAVQAEFLAEGLHAGAPADGDFRDGRERPPPRLGLHSLYSVYLL